MVVGRLIFVDYIMSALHYLQLLVELHIDLFMLLHPSLPGQRFAHRLAIAISHLITTTLVQSQTFDLRYPGLRMV
ncbi:hypothetical protein SCLCIDRAFT_1207221 [Scleroderma citrinum Foug A]|uniref:Uncharacterized protein n=1 Tax=Scleroderma citrinum Foug A TaxID=1036808 RepID=A0A0C3EP56_9AGAM|nr:hypothetical protein SCLCIDRAFT_1207221 [Scleroderma citrinum Foug A]